MTIKGWIEVGIDKGRPVDLTRLKADRVDDATYNSARRTVLRGCNDIFLQVTRSDGKKGIFLFVRDHKPLKGQLWCIGGGIRRGGSGVWDPVNPTKNTEQAIHKIVKNESGLEVKGNMIYLGNARLYLEDYPATGNGVDEICHCFFGRAEGEIKLDKLHKDPRIVTPEEYRKIRKTLHPYIQIFMDKAILLIK